MQTAPQRYTEVDSFIITCVNPVNAFDWTAGLTSLETINAKLQGLVQMA